MHRRANSRASTRKILQVQKWTCFFIHTGQLRRIELRMHCEGYKTCQWHVLPSKGAVSEANKPRGCAQHIRWFDSPRLHQTITDPRASCGSFVSMTYKLARRIGARNLISLFCRTAKLLDTTRQLHGHLRPYRLRFRYLRVPKYAQSLIGRICSADLPLADI